MEIKSKVSKMKECTKCKKSFPADKEHFYADKNSRDGLAWWCKECHNKSSNKGAGKKNKTRPAARTPQKPVEIKPCSRAVNDQNTEKLLTIDFTGHETLQREIYEYAKKEFRTPENQLLCWLSNIELSEKIII